MTLKKLDLDSAKRATLMASLRTACESMPQDMQGIYRDTIAKTVGADKLLLTEAQVNACKYALGLSSGMAGANDMLDQLNLTRRQYASLHPSV